MMYSQAVTELLALAVKRFKAETLLLKAGVVVVKVDVVVGLRDIVNQQGMR